MHQPSNFVLGGMSFSQRLSVGSRLMITLLIIASGIMMGSLAQADDQQSLQGKWQRKITYQGLPGIVTKTIEGDTETVEVRVGDKLLQHHKVVFSLRQYGPTKVFQWERGLHIGGANRGKKLPDGRCLYRIEPNRWICVHGMLQDDTRSFQVEVYDRIEQAEKKPAI